MEHLFFHPTRYELAAEADRISKSNHVGCDWTDTSSLNGVISRPLSEAISWPICPLLGYSHEQKAFLEERTLFRDYPKVQGWNSPVLDELSRPQISTQVTARNVFEPRNLAVICLKPSYTRDAYMRNLRGFVGLLQTWLIFGLLEDLCRKALKSIYLARSDDPRGSVLDTRNLTYLLYRQVQRMRTLKKLNDQDDTEMKYLRYLFNAHGNILDNLSYSIAALKGPFGSAKLCAAHDDPSLLESASKDPTLAYWKDFREVIEIVGSTLLVARGIREVSAHACNHVWSENSNRILCLKNSYESSSSPWDSLAKAGFCRKWWKTVEKLLSRGICETTWRYLAWWGHATGVPKMEDHSRCSPTACVMDNIQTLTPKHRAHCSEGLCSYMKPDWCDCQSMLRRGMIPLLRIKKSRHSKQLALMFDTRSRSRAPAYFSISHVWRQGLGSHAEKGLPTCQVQFLERVLSEPVFAKYSSSTDDFILSAPFWIDSLCIPKSTQLRRRALGGINDIFRRSAGVVVIDQAFLQLDCKATYESRMAAVICSAWQTRLWTWLEKVSAKKLYIMLRDDVWSPGFAETGVLLTDDHLKRDSMSVPAFMRLVAKDLRKIAQLDVGGVHIPRQSLLKAIAFREVTKPYDEALVLAAACKLQVEKIVVAEPWDRMAAFYTELKRLPASWLFLGLPTLVNDNLTWAPATLRLQYSMFPCDAEPQTNNFCDVSSNCLLGLFGIMSMEHPEHLEIDPSASSNDKLSNRGRPITCWHSGGVEHYNLRFSPTADAYLPDTYRSVLADPIDIVIFSGFHDEFNSHGECLFRVLLAKSLKQDEEGIRCEICALAFLTGTSFPQDSDRCMTGYYRPTQQVQIVGSSTSWQKVINETQPPQRPAL